MSTETSRGERALKALRPVRVFHPMLLALIPLCGLYAQNAGLLTISALIRPAAALITISLVLWVAFSVLRGNRYHGGLLASALIVPCFVLWGVLEDFIRGIIPIMSATPRGTFYALFGVFALAVIGFVSYRYAKDTVALRRAVVLSAVALVVTLLVATFVLAPIFGRRAAWLITAYLMAVVAGLWFAWRYDGDCKIATRSMNWFALILLALYGAVLVVNRTPQPDLAPRPLAVAPASTDDTSPDIYVLALDGYASSDVLRTAYAYNNLAFEEEMKSLGFEIATQSRANYPQAELSLASMLNMDYLPELLASDSERESAGMQHVFALFHKNRVFSIARERGYDVMVFSPGLESLEPRAEDVTVLTPPGVLGEFEMVLIDRTIASRIIQAGYYLRYNNPAYWRYAFRRERILYMFDELPRLARVESAKPRLVFATMLVPEPPYLFTRDGGRAQPFGPGSLANDRMFRGRESEYQEAYLDQVHFVNQKLAEAARLIIESSKRPVAILILSSRGAPPALTRQPDATVERYRNLLMARFPQPATDPANAFRDDLSLVNVFPLTMNRLFGAGLPLRPDVTYTVAENRPFVSQQADAQP